MESAGIMVYETIGLIKTLIHGPKHYGDEVKAQSIGDEWFGQLI